jgi:serine-type D-Ala-D-Ala endopeptidase (penicillin-binding protein 7)
VTRAAVIVMVGAAHTDLRIAAIKTSRRYLHSVAFLLAAFIPLLVLAPAASATVAARSGARGPDVHSKAVLVMDRENNVVFERDADVVAPIASITKLMTALVVLDGKQPLDATLEISADDVSRSNPSRLKVGTRLTRSQLLRLALMSSENRAAHALGRNYPGGLAAFVKTMNAKATALGMSRSRFVDPTGLSSDNVSTARDLVKLVMAGSRNPVIREYSTTPSFEVKVGRQPMLFHSTNALVGKPNWDITVQKTGFINEAGQCLVMLASIDDRPMVFVLLNAFGKHTRVADARRIRQWVDQQRARGQGAVPRAAVARKAG